MRAGRIREQGGPLTLEEAPEPAPGEGELLVEMAAAGINPVDLATSAGRHYSGLPGFPYTAGTEGVGRVVAGDDALLGRRVYTARTPTGTLAERFVARPVETWPLPDDADDAVAVALGISALAAWVPLWDRAGVGPGDRVLVLGASGAIGRTGVQAARLLGADLVVAAGRDQAALERARALGADAVVDLAAEDLAAALREPFGDAGPTVVLDPLWGAPARAAVDVAAVHARIVHMGQSAGDVASLPSAAVRGKELRLLGYSNRLVPLEIRRAAHLTMLEHVAAGRLQLDIERVPLDRAPEAWEAVRAGAHVRPVVTR